MWGLCLKCKCSLVEGSCFKEEYSNHDYDRKTCKIICSDAGKEAEWSDTIYAKKMWRKMMLRG